MSENEQFRICAGLPAYGSAPRPFSPTGQGLHREGFVVEFLPQTSESWIGNFQPGLTSYNAVFAQDAGKLHLVVASGQGYLIDTITGDVKADFGGFIERVDALHDIDALLFCNGVSFTLRRGTELLWSSPRLSWNGMRNIQILNGKITGEAWCYDDTWDSFEVDLATGNASGGTYQEFQP